MNSSENRVFPSEIPTVSTQLLIGVQAMNPESWSRMVNTFGPVVYRWCRSGGVPEADAADLVQDVFIAVARGIGHFQRQKKQGSFRSWLATITRNQVRDFFRKQAKRDLAAGGTDAWQRMQESPDELDSTICADNAMSSITRRVLESVRGEFESATWTAFWMTAVEGKTGEETSEATGISVSSVYQAKSRILRRLRQRLSELPN